MRTVGPDGGPAIHLMADVADNEVELIAFDCFRLNPHYHYGPRNKTDLLSVLLVMLLIGRLGKKNRPCRLAHGARQN